ATVMAYLAAACGKPLSSQALDVYWDLLHELPFAALQTAAKQALLRCDFPVFPAVGLLHRLAQVAVPRTLPQPVVTKRLMLSPEERIRLWKEHQQREEEVQLKRVAEREK